MAISKERKNEIIHQYAEWMQHSRAMVLVEYKGLSMSEIDAIRSKIREMGGEFHVVKNTLGKLAFQQAGLQIPESYFEGSTAIGFAFEDAPAFAKMMTETARSSEFLKIKGGYLGKQSMRPSEIRDLADLPPLPVLRARILGALVAPASQLARTLSEPARQVAAVFKAYAEREAAPEVA